MLLEVSAPHPRYKRASDGEALIAELHLLATQFHETSVSMRAIEDRASVEFQALQLQAQKIKARTARVYTAIRNHRNKQGFL
jgi:hypothetical protein